MPRRMTATVPRNSRCSAGVSACANGWSRMCLEILPQVQQQRLVAQQRERASNARPSGVSVVSSSVLRRYSSRTSPIGRSSLRKSR